MTGLGTLINVLTVLAGSGLGVWLGSRLPEGLRSTLTQGLGVVTVVVALDMARSTTNALIILGSILLGGLLGELLALDQRLQALGRAAERALAWRRRAVRLAAASSPAPPGQGTPPARSDAGQGMAVPAPPGARPGGPDIAQGFVTASLLFCVGPMTVVGSLQDGLRGDFHLLAVKATLDGFASIALASTLGAGVALAALTVLAIQGGLTVLAGLISPWLTETMVAEMTAAGGAVVLMIGLSLLEIKRLPVANFLPALLFAPLIAWLASLL